MKQKAAGETLQCEEIKSGQTLKDDALKERKTMNLKNCKYMKSTEFKERQLWLGFIDAVGIALKVITDSVENFRAWFKSWKNKTMKNKFDNRTLELDFSQEKTEQKKIIEKKFIDIMALEYLGIGSGWCVLSRSEEDRHCVKTKREKFPNIFK